MRRFNFILFGFLVWAAVTPAQTVPLNGVAAIVNDSIITFQEVKKSAQVVVDALPRPPQISAETYEKKRNEAWSDSLESLITRQLILDDFKSTGIKIPPSLVNDEIQGRIRKRFGDRVRLIKSLQAEGLTFESFRQQEHDQLILEYMRYKNVSQNLLISPQKIDTFYQTNLSLYQVGEQVKVRAIVLNSPVPGMMEEVKRLAHEIALKVEDGADFAEMASVYSEGSQRTEGGDWGWRDRTFLKKGLSDTVFALNSGERSPVLGLAYAPEQSYWIYKYDKDGRLSSGRKYNNKEAFIEEKTFGNADTPPAVPQEFYLLFVENKRTAHTKPVEEVREEIEKTLIAQERSRLLKKWVERLRAKAFVRYFL